MDFTWGWDNGRALLGIVAIYGLAFLLSRHKARFPWKLVIGATVLQFAFALLLFGVPWIRQGLFALNGPVDALVEATKAGTRFVFGKHLGDSGEWSDQMGEPTAIFLFQLLPLVIVVASLAAILWHWGVLRWIIKGFAFIFRRTMGLGGATSLATAANVFMGMVEAPVLVKPYFKGLTRSELFILMTVGFATIAGSVMVIYVTFLTPVFEAQGLNALAQLITASLVAVPAAVALALSLEPETVDVKDRAHEPDFKYQSTMDAFAQGATDGLQIVLNIATMLIAALAILALVNMGLGAAPDVAGAPLSVERILGWVFAPLMYMIGIPWGEAQTAGSLMGVKVVLTEFVAFERLGFNTPAEALSPHSRLILTHALCGFANVGSIGILIGGLSIIAPERRDVFLSLAWKTLLAGTLATCLSGAVVGALPVELFVKG